MKNVKEMSHKELVLDYMLDFGPISPLKAQSEFKCWRLAAVIHRLRGDGWRIITMTRHTFSGKRFTEYRCVS